MDGEDRLRMVTGLPRVLQRVAKSLRTRLFPSTLCFEGMVFTSNLLVGFGGFVFLFFLIRLEGRMFGSV